MFSCNGKISEKQIRRMIVLSVFASMMFVVPYLSAQMFGDSVVLGLLTFFALSGIYVLYIYGMGELYERCSAPASEKGFAGVLSGSGLVGSVLSLIQLSRLVLRLSFYILLTIALLGEAQVPFMLKTNEEIWSNVLVAMPLLLVCVYGANKQIEKQSRIHEMLFWLLFVPFIAMLAFGLKEVDYEIFRPKAELSLGKLLRYSYVMLVFVLPAEYYLYLRPYLRHHKEKNRTGVAVIITVALGILLTLFMLGIYGLHGAAEEPMTTIAIMRYIRLPFGVLERFDVLMIWFLIIGCFVLICQSLYFAEYIFCKGLHKKTSVWILVTILILSLGVATYVRTYENGLLTFLCYGALMDIPLSVVLPVIGILLNRFYVKEEKS